MKILIGSDHIGYPRKADLISFLGSLGHAVIDIACKGEFDVVDYPDIAVALAERIRSRE
jgi:ribose 5-phosphate isomerase B